MASYRTFDDLLQHYEDGIIIELSDPQKRTWTLDEGIDDGKGFLGDAIDILSDQIGDELTAMGLTTQWDGAEELMYLTVNGDDRRFVVGGIGEPNKRDSKFVCYLSVDDE